MFSSSSLEYHTVLPSRKFSLLIKRVPSSLDFALFDGQPASCLIWISMIFGLAYSSTAWGQHVIVKHISYLMCLPIRTDYRWPVEHKLSMWWFKSARSATLVCRSHAGHWVWAAAHVVQKNSGEYSQTPLHCGHIKTGFSLKAVQVIQNPIGAMNLFVWSGCALKCLIRELDSRAVPVRNAEVKSWKEVELFWWSVSNGMMRVLLI